MRKSVERLELVYKMRKYREYFLSVSFKMRLDMDRLVNILTRLIYMKRKMKNRLFVEN